jgi:hypothetical protein
MLKDTQAILAMLKEQEKALESEDDNRVKRDDSLIETIKQDAVAFHALLDVMLGNVRLAIRKIEGNQEESNAG